MDGSIKKVEEFYELMTTILKTVSSINITIVISDFSVNNARKI